MVLKTLKEIELRTGNRTRVQSKYVLGQNERGDLAPYSIELDQPIPVPMWTPGRPVNQPHGR